VTRYSFASVVNISKVYRLISIQIKLTNYKAWYELKGIYVIYETNVGIIVTKIRREPISPNHLYHKSVVTEPLNIVTGCSRLFTVTVGKIEEDE